MIKKPFSKILVPLDGSENADKALDNALLIAEKFRSKITLIHVISDFVPEFAITPDGFAIPNTTVLEVRESINKNAETMLKQRLEKVQKNNLMVDQVIKVGDPGSEIMDFAEKNQIDLILMGARGLGTFKKLLLGSVSDKVTSHSHCPVLIVK